MSVPRRIGAGAPRWPAEAANHRVVLGDDHHAADVASFPEDGRAVERLERRTCRTAIETRSRFSSVATPSARMFKRPEEITSASQGSMTVILGMVPKSAKSSAAWWFGS